MKTEDTFTSVVAYVRYSTSLLTADASLKTSSLLCQPGLTRNIICLPFFVAGPGCWKTHFSSAGPLRWKKYFPFAGPARWNYHLSCAGARYGPRARPRPGQTSTLCI